MFYAKLANTLHLETLCTYNHISYLFYESPDRAYHVTYRSRVL